MRTGCRGSSPSGPGATGGSAHVQGRQLPRSAMHASGVGAMAAQAGPSQPQPTKGAQALPSQT
ncbi:MAG TPA: hypothetical protein VFS00_09035 [Polyangiaceae bacterium]|nr:hypothetical protein [Polyangiaceae bacterium]